MSSTNLTPIKVYLYGIKTPVASNNNNSQNDVK